MDFEMLKAAIKEIAGNHNLSEKVVVASLESAIEKAYLREIKTPDAEVKVGLDMETGLITVAQLKLVMKDEEIQDDALEIDYDAAKEDADLFLENLEEEKEEALKDREEALSQKKSPKRESRLKDLDWRLLEVENLSRLVKEARENVRFGGKYPMYCDIESLSKMIVRMVGSGFRQAIAEAEREALYDVYKDHIGEMETGIVDKADERTIVVRLRHGVTEMSRRELIGEETFKPGEQIKVYIEEVRPVNEPGKPQRGPQVQATRASEGFLRRLFEEEIREVYDGTVLIKGVAREAGVRSKVAVLSTDDAIDATGACIGAQGSRIQKVVDQLGHNLSEKEKIDIISYSDYLPLYAAESLRPAEVLGVHISEEEPEEGKHRVCHLIVDESQKKRAYGRKRSNQRLAGKLTGLHMEILTPEEAEDLGIEWTPTEELRKLRDYAGDEETRKEALRIKLENKKDFALFVKKEYGIDIDPTSVVDTQIKRLHAYKRQLMNVFRIMHLYARLKRGESFGMLPHTFVFGAKAAPSYEYAKRIIELILAVQDVVNGDEAVNSLMKVCFVENYGVSLAERIIPATDLSEQISTAGKEASGTSNMKFMMNGALTIGTLDGANIEIAELAGKEHEIIFGLTEPEVNALLGNGSYSPWDLYNGDHDIKNVMDSLFNGPWALGKGDRFRLIFDEIMNHGDQYLILKDFRAYLEASRRADDFYRDEERWGEAMIHNIAMSGYFSSDRTIEEYNRDIWHLDRLEVRE